MSEFQPNALLCLIIVGEGGSNNFKDLIKGLNIQIS